MTAKATVVVVLVVAAAAMAFIVREQRAANGKILSTLDAVTAALTNQTNRSRELEQQVAALSDRVLSLEKEVVDLRRRVVRLSRPAEIARVMPPLEVDLLAPYAPYAPLPEDPKTLGPQDLVVAEVIPITWSTDWRSFQPAGIIASPAPVVIGRKLSDPAFVKKLYAGYAALQVSDIISTSVGLGRNAREANPLLRGVARSPAALAGVKAATTVATILVLEKLRKRSPVATSITLIAVNATLAAVTINNVAVANSKNGVKP